MATAMAVEEINAAGGLLGRKIELKQYDSQSDIALYTKFAQQLTREDKVDVVHGGITSASREAIRQTFRRANTLYFYNVLYEGGVCDRNCMVTGTTPAQAVEPVIEHAMKQWGNKVYTLAADYNYGQITAKWVAALCRAAQGHRAQDRLLPARRRGFRLDHREDPGRGAELRGRRAGRRRAPVVLPAMGRIRHEQEDPARLDDLRRRQRAPRALARRGRRHPDRRQLQPGDRHAGQQGLPGALAEEVRRRQDRARDRRVAVPGHHAVGRMRQEGGLARPRRAAQGDRIRIRRSKARPAPSRWKPRRTTRRSISS